MGIGGQLKQIHQCNGTGCHTSVGWRTNVRERRVDAKCTLSRQVTCESINAFKMWSLAKKLCFITYQRKLSELCTTMYIYRYYLHRYLQWQKLEATLMFNYKHWLSKLWFRHTMKKIPPLKLSWWKYTDIKSACEIYFLRVLHWDSVHFLIWG